MLLSEVTNLVEYFRYSFDTRYDLRVYNLIQIELDKYDLRLVELFLLECMSFGGDYVDERRQWLENNRACIEKLALEFSFKEDVFATFEAVAK